jgi:hypothetical protein
MRFGKTLSRRLGPAGLPIAIAALSVIVAFAAIPEIQDAGFLLTHDDPADIADHTLARTFTTDVADRQIRAALDEGDIDLANSFAELAHDRGVPIAPDIASRLESANSTSATAKRQAGSFVHGLITGQPDDTAGLVGTGLGDLFVFGDVRDATREGLRLARGEEADEAILGLACVGIAVTAGTYASFGIATPARVGLSLVKVARTTGRMSTRLAKALSRSARDVVDTVALRRALTNVSWSAPLVSVRAARDAVKLERAGMLVNLAGDVGRIETRAGSRAALDGLRLAEEPREVARVAKLAEKEGGRTRAILRLLGRAVLAVGLFSWQSASWLITAGLMAFAFCSALKGMVERATQSALRCRRRRRERDRLAAVTQSA